MSKLVCRLKDIMSVRGISINKLAADINHARSTITALVNNEDLSNKRIPGDLIIKLCDYFNVGIEELFEYIPDRVKADKILDQVKNTGEAWFTLYGETAVVYAYHYNYWNIKDRAGREWRVEYLDGNNLFATNSFGKLRDWFYEETKEMYLVVLDKKPIEKNEVYKQIKRYAKRYMLCYFTWNNTVSRLYKVINGIDVNLSEYYAWAIETDREFHPFETLEDAIYWLESNSEENELKILSPYELYQRKRIIKEFEDIEFDN
jgi:DNA-binding Xre family transcriptional regulator